MQKKEFEALSVGEQQRKIKDFVDREVFYCASSLISTLAERTVFQENLLELFFKDDYKTVGLDYISNLETEKLTKLLCDYGVPFCHLASNKDDRDGKEEAIENHVNDEFEGDWQNFCDFVDIEPHTVEALEHWIISNWLADKLEKQGEMIDKDFLGLTLWGRTCSGQAILLDSVIEDIYKVYILEDDREEPPTDPEPCTHCGTDLSKPGAIFTFVRVEQQGKLENGRFVTTSQGSKARDRERLLCAVCQYGVEVLK